MKKGTYRTVAERSLERLGFVRTDLGLSGSVWDRGTGAARFYFEPQLGRQHGMVRIDGIIGIYVTEFEDWWSDQFLEVLEGTTKRVPMVFSRLASNDTGALYLEDRELETPALQAVLNQILSVEVNLPKSLDDLLDCLEAGQLGGKPISGWLSFLPLRALAFRKWLLEVKGEQRGALVVDDSSLERAEKNLPDLRATFGTLIDEIERWRVGEPKVALS